ncbi:MAG: acyl-CoA ligase (AMP-forming), exosortase A system-associated [Nitrosomonas sp.]|nr:MAG: acyl-CoA ligase (AMP-forming), exosortase A system-associated [Nitrosomonas sp.]
MPDLIHELIFAAAARSPSAPALVYQDQTLDYAALEREVANAAAGLQALGLSRGERVAVYLEKRFETVIALFAAAAAGGVFVPVNPTLKAEQVIHIVTDCSVRVLITSTERLKLLQNLLPACPSLHTIVVIDDGDPMPSVANIPTVHWKTLLTGSSSVTVRCIDADIAAIIYTSGSTGKPKGVVLSHRNLIAGAKSVSQYLGNRPDDRILTVLPLSFDYGLSQLTTAFYAGAANVLMNYLFARDIVTAVETQQITGLAAVPPLWIQLAALDWRGTASLRYLTSSGGAMPRETLNRLRRALPDAQIFLMYGFTEAFRSTYLPPEAIDRHPNSIGKAIPNAEVLVLREDGSPCVAGEPGELVHRGALVALGYWNDTKKTAQCFKPINAHDGLPLAEIAAWSGDTVRMDEQGFLYFIERRDDLIKTSGYRVSPTEVEEIIYATGCVDEAAAIGVPHPVLGQAIVAIVTSNHSAQLSAEALMSACKKRLPAYMLPSRIDIRTGYLPRNPNGKIDRKSLHREFQHIFMEQGR